MLLLDMILQAVTRIATYRQLLLFSMDELVEGCLLDISIFSKWVRKVFYCVCLINIAPFLAFTLFLFIADTTLTSFHIPKTSFLLLHLLEPVVWP